VPQVFEDYLASRHIKQAITDDGMFLRVGNVVKMCAFSDRTFQWFEQGSCGESLWDPMSDFEQLII
jgi:hypothetical protein